jgi:hypothetical protein
VLLGCVQPGQASAVYADALGRLADRLHYLNSTGDKAADTTRFWFDTRANLRREMEDRKRRFDDATDVRKKVEEAVKKLFAHAPLFDGVHVFAPHADIPDDTALRLVALPPDQWYMKDSPRQATDAVLEHLRSHGPQPRHRANRLLFVAADHAVLGRLKDTARVALAWASIVEDVDEGRLNIDQAQRKQADKEAKAAADVLPRAARECFRWLLCPVQDDPRADRPAVEAFALNTTSGTAGGELERVCRENELVIETWSPIHLRAKLKELYWKADRPAVGALAFWEDTQKYLYLPRLRDRDVLAAAIRSGAASRDFFGTAYGQDGGKYDGFEFGTGNVSINDTLLLIEPDAAKEYAVALKKLIVADPPEGKSGGGSVSGTPATEGDKPGKTGVTTVTPAKAKSFHGSVDVPAATAKMKLVQIAEEIVKVLTQDPTTAVRVTVEITADFPAGAGDATKRAVSENATSLGFKAKEWE